MPCVGPTPAVTRAPDGAALAAVCKRRDGGVRRVDRAVRRRGFTAQLDDPSALPRAINGSDKVTAAGCRDEHGLRIGGDALQHVAMIAARIATRLEGKRDLRKPVVVSRQRVLRQLATVLVL